MRKKASGFTESSSGVRDVQMRSAGSKIVDALRYVPIGFLFIAVTAGAGIGIWYDASHPTPPPAVTQK